MVSFVYFDLGGVVILDFSVGGKWEQLAKELGTKDLGEFVAFWRKYETDLLLGKDPDAIMRLIRTKFRPDLPEGYSLVMDGFVKRLEANKTIWPVIETIHKKNRIGLLTNAYAEMLNGIRKMGILPNVDWNVIVDSSVVRAVKPDFDIYEIAEERAGVEGEEIFFIDNKKENLNGAKEFEWQTFLYDPKNPEESSNKLLKRFI